MYALITGASSGIGREMALLLAQRGYDLILAARREGRLQKIKERLEGRLPVKVLCRPCDLSDPREALSLYESCEGLPVTVLVNAAGFGKVGRFADVPLEEEISMIQTNVLALHVLTKKFAASMTEGHILNVASIAAFQPGPYLSAYSATKAYVASLSLALGYEMRRSGSKVAVSTLCPGPVRTEFDRVAGTSFSLPSISARKCAKAGIDGMFRGKALILPSLSAKLCYVGSKLAPLRLVLPVEYLVQTAKLR